MKLYFDLETASADQLFVYGEGFCRIAGYAIDDGPVQLTTDMNELIELINQAQEVYAHNGLAFDLVALERYFDLDLEKLVYESRVRDTLLMAHHNDPPLPGHGDDKRYSLEAMGQRLFGEGKTNGLKRLVNQYGGFDKIPVDNAEYREYLVQDVELLRKVAKTLQWSPYLEREHKALYRIGFISKNGWLVDTEAIEQTLKANQEKADGLVLQMHRKYGLPLSTTVAKKFGEPLPEKEIISPHATLAGKKALQQAFVDCGVVPPQTPSGSLALNADALNQLVKDNPENKALADLVEMISSLVSQRTVAMTIAENTLSDGRVHPNVSAIQNTGRFSVTKPGLTVMGKRKRENLLERAFLLPDPGEVLLCVDLSQIDARAMAAHSQDPDYLAVFEPGKDFHTEMAMSLFGDPSRRSDAKPVTHATSYGMGAKALADYAGFEITNAQHALQVLDIKFPKLAYFKKVARQQAISGFVYNAFGRPIRIESGSEYTKGPASFGQGTARDLLVEGVLRLPRKTLPMLRAIIHDELVFSIPVGELEELRSEILSAMQFSFQITPGAIAVPILAESSVPGVDWADCYREDCAKWVEVSAAHRQLETCTDSCCTAHNVL